MIVLHLVVDGYAGFEAPLPADGDARVVEVVNVVVGKGVVVGVHVVDANGGAVHVTTIVDVVVGDADVVGFEFW